MSYAGKIEELIAERDELCERVITFETMATKRHNEAATVEDWKRIAEMMEYNWRCCSSGFNKTCGELRAKLATLKQAQEPVAWYDPTNANPGQSVTFFKADRDRWPHLYPVPLYAAPKQGES